MKNEIKIFGLLSLIILTSACKFDPEKMDNNKNVFESHRSEFEQLVNLIKQLREEKKINKNTFQTQEADKAIQDKLEDLDIVSVRIVSSRCEEIKDIEIDFIMNRGIMSLWYAPGEFMISYVPCSDQTNKTYKSYDGYHINMYGLGDDWMMYSDTDFI